MIRWYIADRQRGKTESLITWVKEGVRTRRYPGWSRIILVSSMAEADRLRGGDPATNRFGLEYQQVFYLDEWRQAFIVDPDVEVGIDNIEFFLYDLLRPTGGIVTRVTATGDTSAWPEVIHKELEEDK